MLYEEFDKIPDFKKDWKDDLIADFTIYKEKSDSIKENIDYKLVNEEIF